MTWRCRKQNCGGDPLVRGDRRILFLRPVFRHKQSSTSCARDHLSPLPARACSINLINCVIGFALKTLSLITFANAVPAVCIPLHLHIMFDYRLMIIVNGDQKWD
jgi:hypothetical protein